MMRRNGLLLLSIAFLLTLFGNAAFAAEDDGAPPVIPNLPATPTLSVSTVPSNGDVNPYGVAFVPTGFPGGGLLKSGDIVVSNFNADSNLQGTGTTIVRIGLDGTQSLFFQGTALGLSTALGVLKRGFVIVGNVPTLNGTGVCTEENGPTADVGQGSLVILDRHGNVVKILTSEKFLDGPWDLTISDKGDSAQVYVSNALSGTVARIDLRIHNNESGGDHIVVERETQIGSGYTHRCDPAAFVVGPTGLAVDEEADTLYVASTGDNAIFAIHNASGAHPDQGTGKLVVSDHVNMHGPLGLARAENGDLITSQGDAVDPDPNHVSEIVEYTSKGQFVAEFPVDPNAGAAFGLALQSSEDGFIFVAVDDFLNVLDVWIAH
jgi:DNA-binding beta-propeller fold protein YncE